MQDEHCNASLSDWARCSVETVGERVSWAVAASAGLFSVTASQWTTALAIISGVLAVILAVLNIILTAIKIRKAARD